MEIVARSRKYFEHIVRLFPLGPVMNYLVCLNYLAYLGLGHIENLSSWVQKMKIETGYDDFFTQNVSWYIRLC